ncbi:nuclear transport factor 2 family protein [Spirosoma oryzicola]|uniref:nuclear transport factor 2 family protein n=1 Tax=Spirosoma oryzicola TaxID=2898794 RepID=UPI001E436CF9|nr:nuclear transport factor 2 family protein [Spirosoma oryzicola]UHG92277.1 nuclear transport factor 2 family protein [Spirosoma oryzicola]
MNKLIIFALIVWATHRKAHGQSAVPTLATDFQSLVEAERAFAAYTEQEGIKAGFSRFLSPEAVVVVQGKFAIGKPLYEKAPFIPGILSWRPVYADIAASGDFGYTTGPFEVRATSKTDTPTGFGHYTTVWQKNDAGVWEAIADVGVIHDAPRQTIAHLIPPATFNQKLLEKVDTLSRQTELQIAEQKLGQLARNYSLQAAYDYALAGGQAVRLYRAGDLPVTGADASANRETATAIYTLSRVAVASSGDMGIAYGYVEYQQKKGPFLRIWKRQSDSSWKVVHEVLDL